MYCRICTARGLYLGLLSVIFMLSAMLVQHLTTVVWTVLLQELTNKQKIKPQSPFQSNRSFLLTYLLTYLLHGAESFLRS